MNNTQLYLLCGIILFPFVLYLCGFFLGKFKVEIGILGNVIRVEWLLWIWPAFSTASLVIFFFVNIVLGWAFGDGFLAPMVISYWNITSEGFIVFWRIMCVLTSILYLELFWIGLIVFFSDKVDWD